MDLVDLEHCGFDYRDFESELSLHGLEKEASWPIAIIVNVGGGHVLTPTTTEETLQKYHQAKRQFDSIVETIKIEA